MIFADAPPRSIEQIEAKQNADAAVWRRQAMKDALERELLGVEHRIGYLTRQAERFDREIKAATEHARPPLKNDRDQALAQRATLLSRVEAIKVQIKAVK